MYLVTNLEGTAAVLCNRHISLFGRAEIPCDVWVLWMFSKLLSGERAIWAGGPAELLGNRCRLAAFLHTWSIRCSLSRRASVVSFGTGSSRTAAPVCLKCGYSWRSNGEELQVEAENGMTHP
jgi:hypothetical protein